MTLYMIGLGLNDMSDITKKGLEAVKECDLVYLENYTSKFNVKASLKELEDLYGKKIILAERKLVEEGSIVEKAKDKNIALLIIGDVFGATTHIALFLDAKKQKVDVKVINNASILNAIGIVGLELYKYGKTVSLPYHEEKFKPTSFYDIILQNNSIGAHTLILLDIKADKARFMTINEALNLLLDVEKEKKKGIFKQETMMVGCARIGGAYKIKYAKIKDLIDENFGSPLHCLILPGELHFKEEEVLELWK